MKMTAILLLLMIPCCLLSAKVNIKDIFSEKDMDKILQGEIVTRMYMKNNPTGVNTDLTIKVPVTEFTQDNYSQYEVIVDEKAFIPYELNDQSRSRFYQTLTAFSKLKGMVYYSRKIQKSQELILDAYTVVSSANLKKISDPVFSQINPSVTSYFLQEDNRFGKLVFQSDLISQGDDFILINTTAQPMAFINNKGDNRIITFFLYSPEHQGFFYYSLNTLRIRYLYNIIENKTNATLFSNRLRASTVHLAKLLNLDWSARLNPWNESKLNKGKYRNY
jgi:hypothetical protein